MFGILTTVKADRSLLLFSKTILSFLTFVNKSVSWLEENRKRI